MNKKNGQNVPRPDNDVFGIRNFFKPADGRLLFLIDFSGFELRIMAAKSGDEVMIDAFRHDGDLHKKTASTLTGKPESEITKTERTHAKAGNFLISYGGTEHALQSNFKKDYNVRKSLEDCAAVIEAVKRTYPKIPVYQKEIVLEAREQGYVQTLLGYIRLLPNINSMSKGFREADERKAANTPIQGTAADLMKRSQNAMYELLAVRPEYQNCWMCAQVHDEVIFEVDNDVELIKQFVTDVKSIMEREPVPGFPVPVIAEASIATRWGEKMDFDKWLATLKN